MLPLASGGDLLPLVVQVEAERIGRPVLLHDVEGLGLLGVLGDEVQVASLGGHVLSDDLLPLGSEVVSLLQRKAGGLDDGEAFAVREDRIGPGGDVDLLPKDLQLLRAALLQSLENMVDDLLDHRHDLLLVRDPGHLAVEGDELRHMTVGVGLLGTECRSDLVDAVQTGGHEDLLVELGGLGQVGGPVEVLDPEQLGSSLGSGGGDLRRVDLLEPVGADGLLDELDHDGLELEDRAYLGFAEVHEAVVETGVHLDVDLVDDAQRKRDGGGGDDLRRGGDDLPSGGGLVAFLDLALDAHDGLAGEGREHTEQLGIDLLLGHGHLVGAALVAHSYERDAAKVPDVLDPSAHGDGPVADGDL